MTKKSSTKLPTNQARYRAMSALQYRAARNMLGVNVETLAKKIGLSRAMSYRYESGFDIPEMVAKMIELLLERGSIPDHW